MTVNPSGWRPSAPANEQGEAQTVTGNRALMLEEPLLFEIGSGRADRRRFRRCSCEAEPVCARPWQGLERPSRDRSAFRASASPKPCATTPACRGRITRSTSACSRSDRAR